ncbi:MAG TPA: prolyl oligopeptidase family serine peptidase [Chitinophagaceae bacterium]|nr:prolyl oligopeptidase family serine peptidase [Chitinophagaceae bacterium]
MRDPKWIGSSPSNPSWSYDSRTLYFWWNPRQAPSDSPYVLRLGDRLPIPATAGQRDSLVSQDALRFNARHTAFTYSKDGDIFYGTLPGGKIRRVTATRQEEADPCFSFSDSRIVYRAGVNLFSWDPVRGTTEQLTDLVASAGDQPTTLGRSGSSPTLQETWMQKDQLAYFQVLRDRKTRREQSASQQPKERLHRIPLDGRRLSDVSISPDGRFITYVLTDRPEGTRRTEVPVYVTESGYTEHLDGRTKVGSPQSVSTAYVFDRQEDTVLAVRTDSLPGIRDLPDYLRDYPERWNEARKNPPARPVWYIGPFWSPSGHQALLDIRSGDHKDRWIALLQPEKGGLRVLDHQHDEAWIGGPGIADPALGWIGEQRCWFQSERTGYSHLYLVDLPSGTQTPLTQGNFEVQQATLSRDHRYFYVITNEVHPGEQQFYRIRIADGLRERITTLTGGNQVWISPDERYLAILYSYFNQPWELYLQENRPGGTLQQITHQARSREFSAYPWRVPELVRIPARDGAQVYARLYKPDSAGPGPHPAVLFVHGAGYLQNAHKWWSLYFREYMFNNLLADRGFYVLDMDYRGSAGYGRDWRTAIYRHMGGKDLDDQVDGASYLVRQYGVDSNRIGIYGGSYGGFLTLMALFTRPGTFAAGAALRPVTNWANYNQGYTSEILNEPFTDSLAYRRSSPLYFAEGLKDHLLICHGMMDMNVHFQDVVELSQRLIELGKDNWQIAPYPMEDHGFVEPSSWTDEYKRILRLFESVLKK